MRLEEKEAVVERWKGLFEEAGVVILSRYTGLKANDMNTVRKACNEQNVVFHVVKNTLAKRALEGGKYEFLQEHFTGPVAVALGVEDQVAPAKVLAKLQKDFEKFEIISGGLDGEELDAAGVDSLAKMPGLDELRAQLLGLINNVPTGIVRCINGLPGGIVNVIEAKRREMEEEGAA